MHSYSIAKNYIRKKEFKQNRDHALFILVENLLKLIDPILFIVYNQTDMIP